MYKRSILEVTVFFCGGLVMVLEIVGSRILAPFIGTSTYIWTSLIGVILASLSLGYWLGGRTADRHPAVSVLATAIFGAGSLVALTVLVKEVVLSKIADAPIALGVKAVLAALLLFAPASICLGFVTPFAVRLRMTSIEETGATVGRLYALSTIGSIAGTFAAGFVLIPFVGSVRTLYLIAGILMGLALLLAPAALSAARIGGLTLLVIAVGASEANSWLLREHNGLYDIDTEYSRVQVFRSTDPATGRPIQALATDPYFVQSAMFLDSDDLVLEYSRFYHLLRLADDPPERTLIIGGAGYSFPKEYLRSYPGSKIDVVEIDPKMTSIARRFFRFEDDQRLTTIHADGRMVLAGAATGTYDAVLMDAFGSLFSVPHHLTTVEAVRDIYRVLDEDGIVIFNLGSALSGEGSRFLHAELATYRAVFPYVYLFKVNSHYADDRLQNLMIAATKQPLAATSPDPAIAGLLDRLYQPPGSDTPMLTDDLAPVEYYNSVAQNLYLSR